MFRKASIAISALALMTATAIIPADAATKISNGVTCTKRNATVKVSGDTYRCTTNPDTTSKKLVWVSADCLTADKTLTTARNQLAEYMQKLKNVVILQVNSIILWSKDKYYTTGEIVYLADSTYYIALADSKGANPLETLGTKWAVNVPTAANNKVGTMPDPNDVILTKQKVVVDWTDTVKTLTDNVTKLQAKTNPDAATKKLITTMQNQINTLNIGIRLVNNRIKNLQNSINLMANNGAKDASAILFRSNIDTAQASRKMLCQKGL